MAAAAIKCKHKINTETKTKQNLAEFILKLKLKKKKMRKRNIKEKKMKKQKIACKMWEWIVRRPDDDHGQIKQSTDLNTRKKMPKRSNPPSRSD